MCLAIERLLFRVSNIPEQRNDARQQCCEEWLDGLKLVLFRLGPERWASASCEASCPDGSTVSRNGTREATID